MRLGTTSYIYPADIITNVRRLAGRIEDIELVLFELDDPSNDVPDRQTISELVRIASLHSMSYTVHLPLDLRLADDDNSSSVEKALRGIQSTADLSPHGFIIHLEGSAQLDRPNLGRWLENCARGLEILGEATGGLEALCVENLDRWPPELLDLILERIPVSGCIDVGHLWMQGIDPIPHLERWLPRARVTHIHGVGTRDHQRLSLMTGAHLDPVVELLDQSFDGVLTFEVFSEESFLDSLETFRQALDRTRSRGVQ